MLALRGGAVSYERGTPVTCFVFQVRADVWKAISLDSIVRLLGAVHTYQVLDTPTESVGHIPESVGLTY